MFRSLIPEYDRMKKQIFITHADVDHCGLLPLFDEILSSRKTKECLELEFKGENGYREQNPLHKPYVCICKALTFYQPPEPEKIQALGYAGRTGQSSGAGRLFRFRGNAFRGLSGKRRPSDRGNGPDRLPASRGVHRGYLCEYARHDTRASCLQPVRAGFDDFRRYRSCSVRRRTKAVLQRLGAGEWKIFGAHGMAKEYNLHVEQG